MTDLPGPGRAVDAPCGPVRRPTGVIDLHPSAADGVSRSPRPDHLFRGQLRRCNSRTTAARAGAGASPRPTRSLTRSTISRRPEAPTEPNQRAPAGLGRWPTGASQGIPRSSAATRSAAPRAHRLGGLYSGQVRSSWRPHQANSTPPPGSAHQCSRRACGVFTCKLQRHASAPSRERVLVGLLPPSPARNW